MNNPVKLTFSAEDLATPTIQRLSGELSRFDGLLTALSGSGGLVVGTIAGIAVAAEKLAQANIGYGAALHDMSQQTGLAVETLSYLRPIAEMSGTSLEAAAGGAQKLSKAMFEAATGNRATADVFHALGVAVTDSTGAMRSSESVLNDVAQSIANLKDPTEKVAAAQLLLGKSGGQLVPLLNEMARNHENLAKWTAEDAAAADQFDDEMSKLGWSVKSAGMALAQDLVPALNQTIENFHAAKDAGYGFLQALTGVGVRGLNETVEDARKAASQRVVELRKEIADIQAEGLEKPQFTGDLIVWGQRIKRLQDAQKELKYYSALQVEVLANENKASYSNEGRTGGPSFTQRMQDIAAQEEADKQAKARQKAAAAEALAEMKRLQAAMTDLDRKSNAIDWGMSPETVKAIEELNSAYEKLGFSADVYNERLAGIIDRDAVMTQQQRDKVKALKDAQEATDKYWNSLQEQIDRARDEADAETNSRSAIAYKTLARMEDARALAQTLALSPEYFSTLDAEIAKQRELAEVLGSKEVSAANKKAAEDSLREWTQITDNINQSLADAIMGGGKSGGELLKQYFKTLVLTPTISALMSPVTNAVGSALGYNVGGGMAGSAIGSSLMGSSLAGSLGFGGGGAGLYGAYMSGVSEAALGASFVGPSASLANGAAGFAGSAGASAAGGLGSTLAAALPWVAGALALASAFGLFDSKGGPKVEGSGMASLTDAGLAQALTGWSGPTAHGGRLEMTGAADAAMQTVAMTFAQSAGAYLKNLGATTSGFAFGLGSSVDPEGTAGDWVNAAVSLNGRSVYSSEYEAARDGGQAALQLETQRMLVAAVKASDVSAIYKDIVAAIDPATASAEQLSAALTQLTQTQQLVALMGDRYSAALAEQAGGLDNLSALVQNYNNVAYTAEEKHARTLEALQGTFASLNMTMPDTLSGFRALVEAQDTTTESGRAAYVTLLGVSSAFADITNSSDQATQAVAQVSETIRALGYVSGDDMAAKVLSDFQGLAEALAGGDVGKQLSLTVDYITGQMESISQKRLAAARSGDAAAVQEYDRELTVLAAERKRKVADLTDYTLFEAAYKGHGAQLVELQNWYDEQKTLLVGNNQALLALEEAYGVKRREIIEGSLGDALTGLRQNIGDWTQGLLTKADVSPLSIQRQMEIARQDYIDTLTGARAEDQTSLSHFTTAAEAYRSVAERMLGHTGDYVAIFNDIINAGGELSQRNLTAATQAATSADIGSLKAAVASLEAALARLLEISNATEASSAAAIVAKLEALIAKLTPAPAAAARV